MSNESNESRLSVVAEEFERAAGDLRILVERIRFSTRLASLAEDFDRIATELKSNISELKGILEDADQPVDKE